ncbi:MAG: ArnT family glycosyltransferase, partial [Phycisphaerae bacterium]
IHVSLVDRDEGWYAQVAREMATTGDWVLPTYQGQPWLGKPPLLYWMAAPVVSVAGRSEAALRLIPLLAMTISVQLVATLGARLFNRRTALVAAIAFATATMPAILGRLFITDALLLAFVLAAALLMEAISRHGTTVVRAIWLGILIGLGILTKGPPILLYVLGILAALLISRCDRQWAKDIRFWTWVPIACLLFVPWYAAVAARAADTLWSQLFVYEFFARFTAPAHGHVGPPGYYFVTSLGGWLPWTPLIPGAVFAAWRTRRRHPALAFCFWWFAIPWLILELVPGKLPHYVLPCYAPIALMFGSLWDVGVDRAISVHQRRALYAWFVMPVLGGTALLALLTGATWRADVPLSLPPLGTALTATILILGGIAGMRSIAKTRLHQAFSFCMVMTTAFWLCLGTTVLPFYEPQRLSRKIANAVNQVAQKRDQIVAVGYDEPTLFFYLDHPAKSMTQTKFSQRFSGPGADGEHVVAILSTSGAAELRQNQGTHDRWKEVARISGLNYVNGRTVEVIIMRGAKTPTGEDEAPAEP